MSRNNAGHRVGAISSADQEVVYLFGYGTYQGEEVPPPGVRFAGMELHTLDRPNPKILLDSGKVVWGYECWWGPEARIRESIGTRRVVELDIEVERTKGGA